MSRPKLSDPNQRAGDGACSRSIGFICIGSPAPHHAAPSALVATSALGAAWWGAGDPMQMKPMERLQAPSPARWFGSDNFGRDIYTRTLYGGRVSLLVGAAVSVVSLLLGTGLGL